MISWVLITKQSISILPIHSYTKLVSTDFDRNFYYVQKGIVHFYLFHPKYTPYLYKNNTYNSVYNHSDYDMFTPDIKKYPKTTKAKYIELIVRENTLIHIPRFYWYCYKSKSNSVVMNIKSENILSFIINLKNIPRHIKFQINKSLNTKNKIT